MQQTEAIQTGISLYRYQPCWEYAQTDNGIERTLRSTRIQADSLWVSKPGNLNDPLDMKPPYDRLHIGLHNKTLAEIGRSSAAIMYATEDVGYPIAIINSDLRAKILKWSEEKASHDSVLEAFERRIATMGVACFTTQYDNPLMWAHYAENGAGFLLEYNVRQMALAESNNSLDWFQIWVTYSSKPSKITLSELILTPLQSAKRVLATKSLLWSYENEWRLLNLKAGNSAHQIPEGIQLKSVILGPKSPTEQFEILKRKCSQWGIPCRQATINDERQFVIQREW